MYNLMTSFTVYERIKNKAEKMKLRKSAALQIIFLTLKA